MRGMQAEVTHTPRSRGVEALDSNRFKGVIASARRLDMTRTRTKPLVRDLRRFRSAYSLTARSIHADANTSVGSTAHRRMLAGNLHASPSRITRGYFDEFQSAVVALFELGSWMKEYASLARLLPTCPSDRSDDNQRYRIAPDSRDDRDFAETIHIPALRISNKRSVRTTLLSRLSQPWQTDPGGAYSRRAIRQLVVALGRHYRTTLSTELESRHNREPRRTTSHRRMIEDGASGQRGQSSRASAALSDSIASTFGAQFTLRDLSGLADRHLRSYWRAQRDNRAVQRTLFHGTQRDATEIATWGSRLHHSNSRGGQLWTSTLGASPISSRDVRLRTKRRAAASLFMETPPPVVATAATSGANASQVSQAMVINFSPTVVVHGGSDIVDLERRVIHAIGYHSHELVRILTRELQKHRRTTF